MMSIQIIYLNKPKLAIFYDCNGTTLVSLRKLVLDMRILPKAMPSCHLINIFKIVEETIVGIYICDFVRYLI